jgi:hypothetical protein
MAAANRIYKVVNGTAVSLVRAPNKVAARNHVARESISVKVATQDDLIELAGTVKVETAGTDPAE